MKIAVLMGGNSPEREVSLNSGKNIAETLRHNGHDVIDFDPSLEPELLAAKFNIDLPSKYLLHTTGLYVNLLLLKHLQIDIAFNALHGGVGENGVVQTLLDQLNIKYSGPGAMACMLAMDKEISKMLLMQNNLPTAKSVSVRDKKKATPPLKDINFPIIVKPADGGSSLGHTVLYDANTLDKAITEAFKYGEKVLIEEYIKGKEIAAAVLNGVPLPLVHIKPLHDMYDYECKYTPGMSSYEVPASLKTQTTTRIQDYAVKMYNLLGCSSYSRVDFLLKENDEMVILEANTLPGMTSTSLLPKAAKAAGISFEELLEAIIQEVLKR